MKIIITESQFTKLNKSNESITNAIIKYMNAYIANGERKISRESRRNKGRREDWCVKGKEVITSIYNFEGDKFKSGYLLVSKNVVDNLCKMLSLRRSYVLHVIAEWYDDTMVPKFEEVIGKSGLSITEIDVRNNEENCYPNAVKPEGITDDEMIDYIINHTLYRYDEVMNRIKSGEEDLEDFYMEILNTQNTKKHRGL